MMMMMHARPSAVRMEVGACRNWAFAKAHRAGLASRETVSQSEKRVELAFCFLKKVKDGERGERS